MDNQNIKNSVQNIRAACKEIVNQFPTCYEVNVVLNCCNHIENELYVLPVPKFKHGQKLICDCDKRIYWTNKTYVPVYIVKGIAISDKNKIFYAVDYINKDGIVLFSYRDQSEDAFAALPQKRNGKGQFCK